MRGYGTLVLAVIVGVGAACASAKSGTAGGGTATAGTEGMRAGEQGSLAASEAAVMTRARQTEIAPESALARLKRGNERFVQGRSVTRDLAGQVSATAPGQYPFAAVLGCIDSRVPPEVVFDQGIGDIFTGRVAGNFVNPDMLGSLEFATKVAGSKLIVVLGHTDCGAVKGACEGVELGHVSKLVTEIRPSVEAVTPEGATCSAEDAELVNDIAVHNVGRTIEEIREKSELISELERRGDLAIVGAMYDVATGRVTFMGGVEHEDRADAR